MTPFLLVPGLNANGEVYEAAGRALWPYGATMVANHLEGEGIEEIARRMLATAPPRFSLIGFSFGGYLSFEILRQAPGRVVKLALIDTTARPDTEEASDIRRRRIAMTEAGKFGLVIAQSFSGSVHPEHATNQTMMATHRRMAETNGPTAYVRHQRAIIARLDSRPGLEAIKVPTVVVVGEADQITPPDQAREMHDRIAGSRLVIVPRAGHMALLEQPEIVNAALVNWARQ